jgi:hypothetical protein
MLRRPILRDQPIGQGRVTAPHRHDQRRLGCSRPAERCISPRETASGLCDRLKHTAWACLLARWSRSPTVRRVHDNRAPSRLRWASGPPHAPEGAQAPCTRMAYESIVTRLSWGGPRRANTGMPSQTLTPTRRCMSSNGRVSDPRRLAAGFPRWTVMAL